VNKVFSQHTEPGRSFIHSWLWFRFQIVLGHLLDFW